MERDRSYWCCVKEWSQSECVFLFTCRFIGVEGGDLINGFLPALGRGALPVNPVHTLSWSGSLRCMLCHWLWLPQSD